MRYAMILKNKVIDIKMSDIVPCYPPDEQGNPVIAIECDETIELGMIYNEETGEFTEYIPPELVPSQLDRIEEALNRSQQEMIDREIDQYTLDLINNGLL